MTQNFRWSSFPGSRMRLTELWNQKPEVSAKQIAVILSAEYDARITEDAVLGKVHRLRLAERTVAVRATRKTRVPSLPVVTIRRDATLDSSELPERTTPAQVVFAARIPRNDVDVRVQCGWELNETHVCGLRRKPGSPFCTTHAHTGSVKAEPQEPGRSLWYWQNKFVNRNR